MGGIGNKDDIIEEFKSASGPDILLSSEIAAEGVDLQFSRFLINYDLPWNPMKIEQRIGRIDRIGQTADKITIWNLVYRDTIDELILERLYNRLDIFKYALGDIEDVLGKKIQQLTSELLSGRLSEDEKKNRIHQTERAIKNKRREEEILEERASSLMAHGDYVIRKISNARKNDQWIQARDIADYVIRFLRGRYSNFEAVRLSYPNKTYVYEIRMPGEAKSDLERFITDRRYPTNSRLISIDPKPIRCLFDNKITIQDNYLEVINHLHPLVQWIGESINKSTIDLHPVATIRIISDMSSPVIKPGEYGYAIQAWAIKGFREHNRLAYQVISIPGDDFFEPDDSEQFIKSAIRDGHPSHNRVTQKDLNKYENFLFNAKMNLDERFKEFDQDTYRSNQDFADLQQRNCEKYYEIDCERTSEIKHAHEERLRKSISSSEQRSFRGLIAATQQKLDKAQEQYERKMYQISQNRKLTSTNTDIAIGLIEVLQ